MKTLNTTIAVLALAFAGSAGASGKGHAYGHDKHVKSPRHDDVEYARVVDVRPLYREVQVSQPVRECWQEPVYRVRHDGHDSAGGMLAGGIIGGIVGHQIGRGSKQRAATAIGTLIGAKIGHDAVNGHGSKHDSELAGYEEHCETHYQKTYERVVDAYDVTYKYRGRTYHVEMPYDPGERIKLRIHFTPVI